MDEDIRRFWNSDSATYDMFVRKGYATVRERRAWQRLFTEALGDGSLNLLDTGCGPGIVSMQLSDIGHRMTAVDFSDGMLDSARRNAAENGLDIDFQWADAEDLPFDDCSFDGVVSDYMLWTVPRPEAVMAEWYRVMRAGGTLVYVDGDWFSDPKSTPFRRRMAAVGSFLDSPRKYIRGKGRDQTGTCRPHVWSASASRPADDLRMLTEAGFVDVRVVHNVQDRVLHGIRHLAHGSTEDHFMIIARKPPVDGRMRAYGAAASHISAALEARSGA